MGEVGQGAVGGRAVSPEGVVTPVGDRVYELREAPDAIRCVETGHARGKVVITV